MKKTCEECGKRKKLHARGLCKSCYNRKFGRVVKRCERCKKEKEHHAFGLCKGCYHRNFRLYLSPGQLRLVRKLLAEENGRIGKEEGKIYRKLLKKFKIRRRHFEEREEIQPVMSIGLKRLKIYG